MAISVVKKTKYKLESYQSSTNAQNFKSIAEFWTPKWVVFLQIRTT